jgi:hypothetical protein
MALFRTDFVGRGELSERQQALGQFLRRAAQMAEEFNICVLMVSTSFLLIRAHLILIRQTKLCRTLGQVLSSQESMVASQLVDMFLHMPLLLEFCFEKVVVRNVWPRLLIHRVSPLFL